MRLSSKILLPLALSIVVVIGVLVGLSLDAQNELLASAEQEELEDHYRLFSLLTREAEARMLSLAINVASDSRVQEWLAEQNRAALLTYLLPQFNALADEGIATNMHLHLPPATSFLRLHSPDKYGDDLSFRSMLVAVNAEQVPISGIEVGVQGLAVRGIVPIAYQGRHVGSLEFGRFLDHQVVQNFKDYSHTHNDLTIYVTDEIATRVMTGLTEQLSVDAPEGFRLYATTRRQRLPIDDALYREVLTTGEQKIVPVASDGHYYTVLLTPLQDYTGSNIGVIELVSSRDALIAGITRNRNIAILIGGGFILLLVLGGGVYMSRQVLQPLIALQRGIERIGQGELNYRFSLDRRDELGELANRFNQMAGQMKELVQGMTSREQELKAQRRELENRTLELEATQHVTFAASERVAPDELLGLVTDLVRDQFDLYHAQVFMVDPERQAAILRESTGYAGSQLLQQNYQIPLDDASYVGQAIRENETVLVGDVSRDGNFQPHPLLSETRSQLVVPLKVGDEVIGVLDVQDRRPDRFTAHTANLFQSLAGQIAFLFENSELLAQVSEQSERLTQFATQLHIVSEIGERLSSILDMELLLREVVELIQNRFGLYHVHIYLLDDATGKLVVRAGSGEVGRLLCQRAHSLELDRPHSLVAQAARSRKTVIVEDANRLDHFVRNPFLPQTRAEMAIPLSVGATILGVLDMQDDQPGRFSGQAVDAFNILARQLATALQNASLFDQVEQSLDETSVRLDVSQALALAKTEPAVLDAIIKQAHLQPEAMVILSLVEPESDPLIFVPQRTISLESGLTPPDLVRYSAVDLPILEHLSPGHALVINSVAEDNRVDSLSRQFLTELGASSLALIPITDGQEWLGLITVLNRQERYFTGRRLRLYQTLAEQGGIVLREVRLREWLRQSRNELQAIYEGMADGMVIAEVKTTAAVQVNPAMADMLGYSQAELLTMTVPQMHPPEARARVGELFGKAIQDKIDYAEAIPMQHKDGTILLVDIGGVQSIQYEGQQCVVAFFRDVTDRKKAEEERMRLFSELEETAERLREADRFKSEFLANMSHELRTPLNSIIGYSEMLMMGMSGDLPDEAAEDAQAILENGQHLLSLINDILDLAKIEAGKLELSMEKIAIGSLVEDIRVNNAGLFIHKPFDFIVEVEDDLPAIVVDPVRINQIVNNLISNAVKFTEDGHVALRAFREDGWVSLQVVDTGIGMNQEELEEIFEKYRQVDGSFKRRAEGTGLGLAITRYLVEMHSGQIDVRSQPGQGTTFTVRLPTDRPETA